jgi:dihydrofolate reductase
MRKLIGAINMTLDGYCDHTAIIPDEEIHHHYTDLLKNADDIIYGRITYQLMEYWVPFVENPSGNKSMDDFAIAIDQIHKIVFSHTMKNVTWRNTRLAKASIQEEVMSLKQKPGRKDILVGSPSLIIQSMNLHLLDELQLCVHPVIVGKGLPLFKNINDRTELKLLKTKTFKGGAVIFYYQPIQSKN